MHSLKRRREIQKYSGRINGIDDIKVVSSFELDLVMINQLLEHDIAIENVQIKQLPTGPLLAIEAVYPEPDPTKILHIKLIDPIAQDGSLYELQLINVVRCKPIDPIIDPIFDRIQLTYFGAAMEVAWTN